ncbi:MAG: hypothetical protein O9312_02830 [Hylemonella sp.]|nr:hypothetical protein [Hylemonella sp.]
MILSIGSSWFVMSFLARLLLSLSCLLAVAGPVTAAEMMTLGAADAPGLHCQHQGPADHGAHGDHDGMVPELDANCADCSACTSHCTPLMIAAPGGLLPLGGSVQAGAAPILLAGITAMPELRPPRF